jgi:hypothetical protein
VKLPRLVAPVLAALLIAGCGGGGGGDNGVPDMTADEIVAAAETAARDASSVHVQGSGESGGQPLELDLYLVAGEGGKGHLVVNGLSFDIVRVGDKAYFKGEDEFWSQFGGPAAVELLRGRWLEASATTGDLASFAPLTDLEALFDAMLADHGVLEKGDETTIEGEPAISVEDTTEGGTLYVATTGEPYPLQVEGGSDSPGTITFTEWNESVELEAPTDTIDFSELQN